MTKKMIKSGKRWLVVGAVVATLAGGYVASADEVVSASSSDQVVEAPVTENPATDPVVPPTTESPVTDPVVPPTTESPVTEAPATETEPSTQPNTPETTTPSTETGGQTGQSGTAQVGEVSKVTNQVVANVSASAPVTLESGASIVDIQSGVATLSDGTKANLTDLGATKNADNTYSIKKSDGEMVTLPETGEVASILSVIGLVASSIGVGGFLKKKKQ